MSQQHTLAEKKSNSILGSINWNMTSISGKVLSLSTKHLLDHSSNAEYSAGAPKRRETSINWSERSREAPRESGCRAPSPAGEAEG